MNIESSTTMRRRKEDFGRFHCCASIIYSVWVDSAVHRYAPLVSGGNMVTEAEHPDKVQDFHAVSCACLGYIPGVGVIAFFCF